MNITLIAKRKMPLEKRLSVTLNSDSTGCFYTGDIVTGTITLDIDKDHKINCIDFEVVGKCEAQWTRSMPTMPYIKIYSQKKKVLYVKNINIFGSHTRNNVLPAGVYSYPFHFALPADLPSTFNSSVAKVYYRIKIKSKPKYTLKKVVPFTVLGTIDINSMDDMLAPVSYEFNKIFKRIAAKVIILMRTYKSIGLRQTMPFEIIIANDKNIRISSVHITLVQKLKYTVSSGYAEHEREILKINDKGIRKNASGLFKLFMEIPQITPSSINVTDPLVEISYVFRLAVCFPFHLNFLEDIPVTVATVPVIHYDL